MVDRARASEDAAPPPDNVVKLAEAFSKPTRKVRGENKADETKKGGGGSEPPAPPPERPGAPKRLPPRRDGCPVEALGTQEGMYHYIDHLGQVRSLKENEHGRLQIISLFGGTDYLNATWPVWEQQMGTGPDGASAVVWTKKDDFKHAQLGPVLIASCGDIGVWDPKNKVRGAGGWTEDDGALVTHAGNKIYRVRDGVLQEVDPGLSGGLLYPRRPPQPQPLFKDTHEAGPRIRDMLDTWHWTRRDIDPDMLLGWLVIALIGHAAPWRPVVWVNGPSGTGKSTLVRFVEWVLGREGAIMPANTTQAFVYQTIGDSSRPVLLDEFESKDDNNKRMEDVIELMRIAASGGELGRGGSDNNPKTYALRSSFAAFSINMPPLEPQDISRMAVLMLKKLKKRAQDEAEFDLSAPVDQDTILGTRDTWSRSGRQLRGRVLQQWPRFLQTFNAYRHALQQIGHNARASFQFGALGAGYDIAMYDALNLEHARAWSKALPPEELAETRGYVDEPKACLQHLLAHPADLVRHGTQETIEHYVLRAREDLMRDVPPNDDQCASRILAKVGLRVLPDAELTDLDTGQPIFWLAVASTHSALIEIFKGTKWRGRSGTPGAWVRALRGLDGVTKKARQMRIGSQKPWVTEIMWPSLFETDSKEERDEAQAQDEALRRARLNERSKR